MCNILIKKKCFLSIEKKIVKVYIVNNLISILTCAKDNFKNLSWDAKRIPRPGIKSVLVGVLFEQIFICKKLKNVFYNSAILLYSPI